MNPLEAETLPIKHKWRIPAFIAGLLDLVYLIAVLVHFVKCSINALKYNSSEASLFDKPAYMIFLLFVLGILVMLHYSVFIPAHLIHFCLTFRVVTETWKTPTGGFDDIYDAAEEADKVYQRLLIWRNSSFFLIGLYSLGLILEGWVVAPVRILIRLIFMIPILKHLKEVQTIVQTQERKEREEATKRYEEAVQQHEQYTNKLRGQTEVKKEE